ncbi:hypothetical protein niasHT_022889 [Heterodera trifolii]|uniref:Uncharacterized protein n=1 Tax=Heterodera trifolii TaxID=157864 RepID=A0ABD2KI43_9BILA
MPKREQQDRSNKGGGGRRRHPPLFADDAKLLPALQKPAFQVKQFTLKTFFELHLEVMGRRDTRAGCLRTFNMTVGDFEPIPPEKVPAAMQDFIRWSTNILRPSQ